MLYSARTEEQITSTQGSDPDNEWLLLARDAYRTSTDYFDANIRRKIENAMAHFGSRHAPGSKYHADAYKYRSRGFRPKTRSVIRRNEAAAAVAYFSTQDVVDVVPENDGDPNQVLSAELNSALLNYRLEHTIQWFLTLVGAYQESQNNGVVISHQYWDYEEDELGYTVVDKPKIDLVPIENFRFSQAADWRDPIGTSPYLIELVPMFVGDIKERMQKIDPKTGEPEWEELSEKEIRAAAEWDYDSVRSAREGQRQDAKDSEHEYTDFDIAWVHRNIVRKDGNDWLFYTLGVQRQLSEPVKLVDAYPHLTYRKRPYTIGFCVIEAHKTYPDGVNTLAHSLQKEANEISNQRRDNVSLALNKRYYGRRGAAVDWNMLKRNIPGSTVLMDDPERDVKSVETPDVTRSAYEEQNRVNVDYDELTGSFSAGSVATNRQMNETVGGMNLLHSDANIVSEYQLRVFNESWVEPTLKQLLVMEQEYETDMQLLQVIGSKTQIGQYGISEVMPVMLGGNMSVRVNVGFGATSPEQRLQKIVTGLDAIMAYRPDAMAQLQLDEVIKEIFGALGYKGADRFFVGMEGDNPEVQQLQEENQMLRQGLESQATEDRSKVEAEMVKANADMERQKAEQEFEAWNKERDREIEWAKLIPTPNPATGGGHQ